MWRGDSDSIANHNIKVMSKVKILDCTLRDGGYINDWRFGEEAIKGICKRLAQTGIEILEVGFIKGETFDPNRTVFPDIECISSMIYPKAEGVQYVAMLDMSAPIPLERITPYDGTSIDGIRVIFKKEKIDEAYRYCKRIKELGYKVFVNFVGTDLYSDKEFVEGIERFNELMPYAVAIVDSFGLIKRKHFLRLAYLADNNLEKDIVLCYHAHNNLQQAFGNAEALIEMNLKRELCVDACVFGMGRGAGNLNLELFAGYMNENYGTQYQIEPMLEIMDEYLNEIYQKKFWGYSLPLYLSASTGCHPNYAIYYAEKGTLTVKSFNELLRSIPKEEKSKYNKERAEMFYRSYQENYYDDRDTIKDLTDIVRDRTVLIIAPGSSVTKYEDAILKYIELRRPLVFAINCAGGKIKADYIFSSNMRRYSKIDNKWNAKCIITSNMCCAKADYVVNFSSYASEKAEIVDNSGVMLLHLLIALGVKAVSIAGMDGYVVCKDSDYYEDQNGLNISELALMRNQLISAELNEIKGRMQLDFITPTNYNIK